MDDYQFPITKTCINGWDNDIVEPECKSYKTKSMDMQCQPGFKLTIINYKVYCVLVTSPQKWNNTCLQYGETILDEELISNLRYSVLYNLTSSWVPVKRADPTEKYLYTSIEKYGTPFDLHHMDNNNGDCIVYNPNMNSLVSEDCNNQHSILCIKNPYEEQKSIQLACPNGFVTTKLAGFQNKCFMIDQVVSRKDKYLWNIFEVTSHEKAYILHNLLQTKMEEDDMVSTVAINIYPDYKTNQVEPFQLNERLKNLEYTNWGRRYSTDGIYVVTNQNSRWFLAEHYNFAAREIEIKIKDPEMKLIFLFGAKRLHLIVYSREFLWRFTPVDSGILCFTNSDGFLLQKVEVKVVTFNQDFQKRKTIYEIEMPNNNTGQYWCSAHSINNFKFVETGKVIASREKNGMIFTALIDVKYENKYNPEIFYKRAISPFYSMFLYNKVRIMKIDSIIQYDYVRFVVHIESDYQKWPLHTDSIIEPLTIKENLIRKLQNLPNNYTLISIKSTEVCFPDETNNLIWPITLIGHTQIPKQLCLTNGSSTRARKCEGDFIYGGTWEEIDEENCAENISDTTELLFQLENSDDKAPEIINNLLVIVSNHTNLGSSDLLFVANILNSLSSRRIESIDVQNIAMVVSKLMFIDSTLAKESQVQLNATNIVLDSFDNIVNVITTENTIETPKLLVFTIDPHIEDVTGIAVFKNESKNTLDNDFSDFYYEFLHSNTDTTELLLKENLEVASYIPSKVLSDIEAMDEHKTAPPIRIVISLFYNDILFQNIQTKNSFESNSVIISISIPGYESEIPGIVPIFFKVKQINENRDATCGHWSFEPSLSDWSSFGCEFYGISSDTIAQCGCSHLTHFSFLLGGNAVQISESHERALNIITIIGCSFSLFGIFAIFLTALLSRSWREKSDSKVILNFSLAISIQMILLLLANIFQFQDSEDKTWCIVFGSFLHYSVLLVFSWMGIIAYLQYLRYVVIFGENTPSHFFMKSFILGWVLPFVIVLTCVLSAPSSYVYENSNICYPSDLTLYLGVILPISLLLLLNIVIFILILRSINRKGPSSTRTSESKINLVKLRLTILLFFILGLSWTFGLLATWTGLLTFSYLFCLTASFLGFVLFVYFILINPVTRRYWRHTFISIGCSCCRDAKHSNIKLLSGVNPTSSTASTSN